MTNRTSPAFRAAEAIIEALYPEAGKPNEYNTRHDTLVALVASIIDLHLPGYHRGTDFVPPHVDAAARMDWAWKKAKGDNRLYHFLREKAKA